MGHNARPARLGRLMSLRSRVSLRVPSGKTCLSECCEPRRKGSEWALTGASALLQRPQCARVSMPAAVSRFLAEHVLQTMIIDRCPRLHQSCQRRREPSAYDHHATGRNRVRKGGWHDARLDWIRSRHTCTMLSRGSRAPTRSPLTTTAAALSAPLARRGAGDARLTVTDSEAARRATSRRSSSPFVLVSSAAVTGLAGSLRVRVRKVADGKPAFELEPGTTLDPMEKRCVLAALSTSTRPRRLGPA